MIPRANSTTTIPPSFTLPGPTLRDTVATDFSAGAGTGTYVAQTGDGEIILAPFEDERPEIIDAVELGQRYSGGDTKALRRAEKLGIIVPLGQGRYEVPSPTLLRAGETLLELGIPLDRALDVIEVVTRQADSVADAFVKLFLERIWKPFDRAGQPDPDWPAVLTALEQLRPLATEVLVAIFQPRMTQATEKAFGRELDRRAKS